MPDFDSILTASDDRTIDPLGNLSLDGFELASIVSFAANNSVTIAPSNPTLQWSREASADPLSLSTGAGLLPSSVDNASAFTTLGSLRAKEATGNPDLITGMVTTGDDRLLGKMENSVPKAVAEATSLVTSSDFSNNSPLLFSPYNWTTASNGIQTSNAGAYLKFRFNGTQATLNVDTSGQTSFPLLDAYVDGQHTANQLWLKNVTNGQATIFNGSAGDHDVVVYFRRREIFSGSNPTVAALKQKDWLQDAEHLKVTGVTVDGSFLSNTFRRAKTAVFFGDSITEGGPQYYQPTAPDRPANYPYANVPNNAAYNTYAARLGDLLGTDYGQIGWSGSGWLRPTTPTGNPPFSDSWLRYNGKSTATRNFAPPPDYIFVNLGTNDKPFNSSENSLNFNVTTTAYTWLKTARQKAPGAEIFIIDPFNQTKNAQLSAAITRYQQEFPNDKKVHNLNLGAEGAQGLRGSTLPYVYTPSFAVDGVHPTSSRHKTLAGLLFDKIKPIVGISSTTIEDRDTASGSGVNNVKYGGNWRAVGDNHVSSTNNSTYTVQFYGDRVQLFGTKAPQNGIAGISIDGGGESRTDLYNSSSKASALLYQSGALGYGYHTIKVRVTGQKNTAATGTSITLDKLKVD
jgi:lysophospholipase L1-like esterase